MTAKFNRGKVLLKKINGRVRSGRRRLRSGGGFAGATPRRFAVFRAGDRNRFMGRAALSRPRAETPL